jgi:hypothetical protein
VSVDSAAVYVAEVGDRPGELALWDVYCGLIALENYRHWIPPFGSKGFAGLTDNQMRSGLVTFVGRAFSAFNAERR